MYEEMMINVKNHHTDPTIRPDMDLKMMKKLIRSMNFSLVHGLMDGVSKGLGGLVCYAIVIKMRPDIDLDSEKNIHIQ